MIKNERKETFGKFDYLNKTFFPYEIDEDEPISSCKEISDAAKNIIGSLFMFGLPSDETDFFKGIITKMIDLDLEMEKKKNINTMKMDELKKQYFYLCTLSEYIFHLSHHSFFYKQFCTQLSKKNITTNMDEYIANLNSALVFHRTMVSEALEQKFHMMKTEKILHIINKQEIEEVGEQLQSTKCFADEKI